MNKNSCDGPKVEAQSISLCANEAPNWRHAFSSGVACLLAGGVNGKLTKNLALTVNATGILTQSYVSGWGLTAGLKLF
jgi:hypothetical protein